MSKRVAGLVLSLMLTLAMLDPAGATTFNVPAGDVATLVANINAANNEGLNPGADTIVLADGNYDLTAINNYWYGPTGLPPIRSDITIRNNGNGATIRRTGGPNFRLFYVSGGHGPVNAGASLQDAIGSAEELEETARIFLMLGADRLRRLSSEEIADLVATFKLEW